MTNNDNLSFDVMKKTLGYHQAKLNFIRLKLDIYLHHHPADDMTHYFKSLIDLCETPAELFITEEEFQSVR